MKHSDQIPDLSVVAASRNDNHGGNLLHRMQLFVNGFINQCVRHNLRAELVLVEWNPPPDKPKLVEALTWPERNGFCDVRIIEVPLEIHKRYKCSAGMPLFQMIGKNVGIQRSRSPFVLATNIDILFSDDLVRFMASGRLRKNRMYRVVRYDVPSDIPMDLPIDAQLDYCRNHVIRISDREGTSNLLTGQYHVVHPRLTWRSRLKENLQDLRLIPISTTSRLLTNACGDFTLMSRERWIELRGYAEFETYSIYIDSLLCHAAHHNGAKEEELGDPARIYHIEHSTGSGWTPEGETKLFNRLDDAGVPQIKYSQFEAWAIQMRRERKPIIFADENWGLASENLTETTVYKK